MSNGWRGRRRGGPKFCVCPDCDYKEVHQRGERCLNKTCPKCGSRLIGKW